MLAWIKKNKEWLFSGIAIGVPLAIIGWLYFSGNDAASPPPDNSVHQTHSGEGDTVGGDKNVTNDNSIHQSNSGEGDVAGENHAPVSSEEGEERVRQTERKFEQALAAARTAEVLFEYAHFLQKQNAFSRAEPLYQEALLLLRSKAEVDPDAFLPDVATTLNNLAILHQKTKDYGPALAAYEEALKIRCGLAAKVPRAFSQDLAETLLNLSIFHLQAVPDKAKSAAYAQEARDILKPLIKKAPHLQGHLDHAEQLLEANKAKSL